MNPTVSAQPKIGCARIIACRRILAVWCLRASQITRLGNHPEKTLAALKRASLLALFIDFLKVAVLVALGARWAIFFLDASVEAKCWMDDHDFAEILTPCHSMPGPTSRGAVWVGRGCENDRGICQPHRFTVIPFTIAASCSGHGSAEPDLCPILRGILGGRFHSCRAVADRN